MISTGTVRKNTARQPKESTTKPPMAGPVTAPTPTVVMIKPIARPFSLAGKAAVMMAIPVPWVMAAPTPCRMREGNSISNVGDIPDIAAPKTITNVPAMKTLLRPIRSDSRPMGRSKALMVRAYVITTHWIVGEIGLEFAGDGRQRHVDAAMIDHRGEDADCQGPKDPVLVVGAAG